MDEASRKVVILLGVSECPKAPILQELPQCENSAEDFFRYLYTVVGLPRKNILDLFDSDLNQGEQLSKISEWLKKKLVEGPQKPTDLILFYTGHGGFTSDQSYFLAIRGTTEDEEGMTSIRFADLADILKLRTRDIRRTLILDCCFSGTAVKDLQAPITTLIGRRVSDSLPIPQVRPSDQGEEMEDEEDLPERGTALFCSSAAHLASLAPDGRPLTMFSEAFLTCLKRGKKNGKQWLSLSDLEVPVQNYIKDAFPTDGVRPELWKPYQIKGNPAKAPLFPNSQYGLDKPLDGSDKLLDGNASSGRPGLAAESLTMAREPVTGTLQSATSATEPQSLSGREVRQAPQARQITLVNFMGLFLFIGFVSGLLGSVVQWALPAPWGESSSQPAAYIFGRLQIFFPGFASPAIFSVCLALVSWFILRIKDLTFLTLLPFVIYGEWVVSTNFARLLPLYDGISKFALYIVFAAQGFSFGAISTFVCCFFLLCFSAQPAYPRSDGGRPLPMSEAPRPTLSSPRSLSELFTLSFFAGVVMAVIASTVWYTYKETHFNVYFSGHVMWQASVLGAMCVLFDGRPFLREIWRWIAFLSIFTFIVLLISLQPYVAALERLDLANPASNVSSR